MKQMTKLLIIPLLFSAVAAAAPADPPLRDKTLVVWVAPANLEQRGGSVLTLDAGQGLFDGIVFGEQTPKKWMPGSEGWRRTQPDQAEWPAETADGKTFVQIAIAYKDRQITIYRNGRQYAQYFMPNTPMEFGPQSTVLIGKRHLDVGEGGRFAGTIDDARIYDRALSAEQIAALKPNVASAIKPWAWWTFDDKLAKDRTGRFDAVKLVDGATVEDGKLVLDGKSAAMRASIKGMNPAAIPVPRGDGWWMDLHNSFNQRVKQGNVDLIFIGDSITDGWKQGGKDTWAKYYGSRHAVNLGIGGDTTQFVLWRLIHGNLDGISPKLAVIMIGTNNAQGNTPEETAEGVTAIVREVQARCSKTKILLLAIFPRGQDAADGLRKKNEQVNAIISKLDDGKSIFYLDLGSKFLQSDGVLPRDIMPDLLHPNQKGYDIWAEAIEPKVKQVMGDNAISPVSQKPLDARPEWEMGPFVKLAAPVLSPAPESKFQCPLQGKEVHWEEQNVYNPAVVVRGGKVYLLYRADDKCWWKFGTEDQATSRIGLASSEDGRHFTRHPLPVVFPDKDAFTKYEWPGGCQDLHVVEGEDGAYYMNYTAWGEGGMSSMCVASSTDLIHWKKHGPAFRKSTPENVSGRTGVVVTRLVGDRLIAAKINGKYWMYYTRPCALAWSDNLIDWTRADKSVAGGHQEAGAIALLRDKDIVLMFNTQAHDSPDWTIGQALIDRNDLTTVLKDRNKPFLYPELDWEKVGFVPNTTVANTLVPFKGRWCLYYGGADRHVGLAVFTPKTASMLATLKDLPPIVEAPGGSPNTPSTPDWDVTSGRLRLRYNGQTLFDGRVLAPAGVVPQLTQKITGEGAIEQVITLSAAAELRLEGVVTGSDEVLAAETRGAAQQQFPLVRTSNGASHNLRNHAVYDRHWDWLLAGPAERTRLEAASATQFRLICTGHAIELSFKPRYYQRHKNLPYFQPWTYRVRQDSITGWCSWWAYRTAFGQHELDTLLGVWKDKRLGDFGYRFIQIDDCYQGGEHAHHKLLGNSYAGGHPATWLQWRKELFPGGMASYVARVKQAGLDPGIWIGSFFGELDVVSQHPDWFVRDIQGKPFAGPWIGYAMDATNPQAVDALIRPTYRGVKQAGFSYVKIDQLRHYLYDNLHRNLDSAIQRGVRPDEVLRGYLRAARQELGPDTFLLACWGVLPEAIGLANACRIGGDGYGPVTMQQYNSWNGIVWRNDPDHCDVFPRFTPAEVGNVAKTREVTPTNNDTVIRPALASIAGCLLMLSDKPEVYQDDRNLEGAKRASPVLFSVPGQLYDFDEAKTAKLRAMERTEIRSGANPTPIDGDQFGPVCPWWLNEFDRPFEHWSVLHRLNWSEQPAAAVSVRFADFGLDPAKDYLVYEFWSRKFLGTLRTQMDLPAIEPMGLRSYALREKLERPQILSTSRHLSQGGVDLAEVRWAGSALAGRSRVIAGDCYQLVLHVPNGYDLRAATFAGKPAETTREGEIVRMSFLPTTTGDVEWRADFTRHDNRSAEAETPQREATSHRPDILIADFEGQDYGIWKVDGDAFGAGPASGTLPGQNPVSNYRGKRLVNSFHGGDGTTGTLTSPSFFIQRKRLSFLIGGGDHPNETCMNLLVDGRIARTETGQNNEKLEPSCWDVAEFAGKQAVLQIVDKHRGGWGHINVDEIVQTDKMMLAMMSMEYKCPSVNKRFMHLPISSGARNVWVHISVDGVWQRELSIALAANKPDFYATLEVGQWQGKRLTLTAEKVYSDSQWRKLIKLSDEMSDEETVYTEKYRPQFHFTARRGGIGDPNGLVYFGGEYHLFGQHSPFQGANATGIESTVWAHAIGSDPFHWVEYPIAVFPDKLGVPFSGSGVVDWKNTAGLVRNPVMDQHGRLKNPAIVVFYASEPMRTRYVGNTSQSMAYSLDSGRTWITYPGNPVVPSFVRENRDPKVFWYEDKKNPGNPHSGRWIMALYLSGPDYVLLSSKDLIHWQRTGGISNIGCVECPDMFELPVDGNKENTRWVFWGGSGNHVIGTFDGRTFRKESGPFSTHVGNEYAAQTFSDIPAEDGRRIQLADLYSEAFPGMPFRNQFTIPRVLTLRTTPEGIRLFIEPAKEIERLRTGETRQITGTLAGADAPLHGGKNLGELVDVETMFEIQGDALSREGANVLGMRINGQTILCDLDQKQLRVLDLVAPLNVVDHKLKLRVILDRMSIEVFVNDGAFRFTKPFVPADGMVPDIQVFGKKGLADVQLKASQLQSIWKKKLKP